MRLLFVCSGNTCRSPMAEALAKQAAMQLGISDLEIGSAGIAALDGAPATPCAQRVMEKRGLSLRDHRSRSLSAGLAEGADLILTMTAAHVTAAARRAPDVQIYALCAYAGEGGDIADPYGGDEREYEDCARRLEPHIRRALERIVRERGGEV